MDGAPLVAGGFQGGHRDANLLLGAVRALCRNAPKKRTLCSLCFVENIELTIGPPQLRSCIHKRPAVCIAAGAMKFTLCLGTAYTGGAPEFHRYNDSSNFPNHLINEGGAVTDSGSNCYAITTVKTSSVAGFNISASPSPSPSPSASPNVTATTDDDSGALLLPLPVRSAAVSAGPQHSTPGPPTHTNGQQCGIHLMC